MTLKWKNRLNSIFGFALLILIIWGVYWVASTIWDTLLTIDTKLAVSLLTAATTVMVATMTVVVGKYLERKKEIESHFREKKVEIYDEFLKEFFKIFFSEDDGANQPKGGEDELVKFLQEWQRKMVLWGGSEVLQIYIKWKNYMASKEPDAQTVFLMGKFFKALRKDVGLSNRSLDDGIFSHLILRNSELFLQMVKENPSITLAEVARKEKELGV